jgi:dTDP-4-amino-4,6-dideoxygalactose transaminase
VFVDIDRETLNLDPEAVREAITPNTRAVICQHTFGIPSDTETLRQTCDVHGILLIEDCAHVLPDAEGPQEIGGRGDAMLLSFGRDKAISGVTGGAIVIRDREVAARVRAQEEHAEDICRCRVRRLLLYPLIYRIAKPLYGIGIGKALLVLARKLHLLLPIVTSEEKAGTLSTKLERMPADCAVLARQQWNDRAALNAHRRRCTSLYLDHATKAGWPVLRGVRADLPLQKFPLFVQSAAGIRRSLGSANIHLEDGWTGCVICPADTILASQGYVPGSDPEAEAAAEMILSLPTHPTMTEHDVNVVCTALDPLLSQ